MQRWLLAKVVAMLSQSNLWDLCYLLLVAIICREAKVLTTVAIEQNAGYVYGDFCRSSAPDSTASALTHCRRRPRPLVDQPQRSAGSALSKSIIACASSRSLEEQSALRDGGPPPTHNGLTGYSRA